MKRWWANPLLILTLINYLNYIDRYILSSVLTAIKEEFALSDFRAGLLATAFIVPYMLTSPLFGWLGDSRPRAKLLSLGAALWSFSSLLTGWARGFTTLAASRFLLGIGESAFSVVSIPFLSDSIEPESRGRKLSLFSTALPVGAALGFVLGGWLSELYGWRVAFLGAGIPGFFLAALAWRLPEPQRIDHGQTKAFRLSDVVNLFRSKKYSFSVFGYCAYAFVVGGIAHWIPAFMQRTFAMSAGTASTLFGGIAVVTGLSGTLFGGWYGDKLARTKDGAHLYISSLSMALSLPFFVLCSMTDNLNLFIVSLVFLEFMFFVSTSPINVALLEATPSKLMTTGMAMAIFFCHILGDAISAPLIGWVSDQTESLRMGLLICVPMIALCAGLWFLGSRHFSPTKPLV